MADKIKKSYKFSKKYRFRGAGITNIKTMQGDVGALPFEEGLFDVVLCMNGLHVSPTKTRLTLRFWRSGWNHIMTSSTSM